MNNQDLITEWCSSLTIQNKSELTISEYRKAVDLLLKLDFFKGRELLSLTSEDLREFMLYRIERDQVTARTLNKNLAGIKNFLNYCLEQKYINENFYSDIKVKNRAKSLPRPISLENIHQILDHKIAANPKYNNQWLRDLAAAEIAYSGGLRIAELHGICLHDMNLQQGTLRVLGKGNTQRLVFLGKKAIEAISVWLLIREKWIQQAAIDDCHFLFISPSGRHISKNHLGFCMTQLLKSKGLNHQGSTHNLRHSFATHMYIRTGNLRAVQEMLGHRSISSTQIYTLVDHQMLTEAYQDAHPRARRTELE